ncbi:hypothetical protein [Caenimonas koreensis]|uniref:hypothetical protein n=1 Tax=Caenimonas koreensis TaxID=367474 RepID=UPI0037830CC8
MADPGARGRLFADLSDINDMCAWFCNAVSALDRPMSQEEMEQFLLDIDIKLNQHLMHHLKSLKREMPKLLEAIATSEGGK